jgi:hypothetical protein
VLHVSPSLWFNYPRHNIWTSSNDGNTFGMSFRKSFVFWEITPLS